MVGDCRAVRFVTFNVCGLKTILGSFKGSKSNNYDALFEALNGDVICLQETKLQASDLTRQLALAEGYTSFFTFSSVKKGYSGVAFFVRSTIGVLKAEEGLTGWLPSGKGKPAYRELENSIGAYPDISRKEGLILDGEGRCLTLDLGSCVVIGLYCPATSNETRIEYRTEFYRTLDERIRSLTLLGREVVVMGDLNVVMEKRDSAEAMSRRASPQPPPPDSSESLSVPLRIAKDWVLGDNPLLTDTTRSMNLEKERMFTCWNQMLNARPSNFGSRLDYILSTSGLEVSAADIQPSVFGSDHCPVFAIFNMATESTEKLPSLSANRIFGTDEGLKSFLRVSEQRKMVEEIPPVARSLTTPNVQTKKRGTQTTMKSFFALKPCEAKETPETVKARPVSVSEQIRTADAWQSIFRRRIPRCYHNEDCKIMSTKKSGPNKGRAFWICQRPFGDENDKEARCKFFVWDSETRK